MIVLLSVVLSRTVVQMMSDVPTTFAGRSHHQSQNSPIPGIAPYLGLLLHYFFFLLFIISNKEIHCRSNLENYKNFSTDN